MNQKEIFTRQLALDYSCSVEEVLGRQHVFTKKAYKEGRRIFRGDDCLVKIACVNGKLLVSAEEEMLGWCREKLADASSAWLFDYPNLHELDEKLRSIGHQIASTHHYYLPQGAELYGGKCPAEGIRLKWFEREDLEQFRKNNPYPEALTFLEKSPDMIGLMAEKDGVPLGMAGASADSAAMWQIGINVVPDAGVAGIGTYLVTTLKNEIMRRGILPFYGTAESHVKSQKVGIQSGFLPAWAEMYSGRQ